MKNLIFLFLLIQYSLNLPHRVILTKSQASKTQYPIHQQNQRSHSFMVDDQYEQHKISEMKIKTSYGMNYIGSIKLGSQKIKMNVIFDTGTSSIWFGNSQCNTCQIAGIKKFFNCQESDSCIETPFNNVTESYGKGKIYGQLITDIFHISDLSVNNQTFLTINRIYSLKDFAADGLIGLGIKQIANGINTFMDNLLIQGLIDHKIFTLYLANPLIDQKLSFLDIGGIDDRLYTGQQIAYCPLVSEKYWAIGISDIKLQYESEESSINIIQFAPDLTIASTIGILDSGTSVIALPTHDLQAVLLAFNYMGFECMYMDQYSQIQCQNTNVYDYPHFKITLCGEHELLIPNYQYILCDYQFCLVRITKLSLSNICILGDIFLQQYFTIFDHENLQIGFAPKMDENQITPLSGMKLMSLIIYTIIYILF